MSSAHSRSQREKDIDDAFNIQIKAGLWVGTPEYRTSNKLSPPLRRRSLSFPRKSYPPRYVATTNVDLFILRQTAARTTAVGVGLTLIAHHTWPFFRWAFHSRDASFMPKLVRGTHSLPVLKSANHSLQGVPHFRV